MTFRTLLLILVALPIPAYTANLTITPSITTSLAYTDNFFLDPSQQKESDFIAQINPGLNVTGIGKRLNLSLNYRMQNTVFQQNNEENNTKHQIQTSATAELAKKKFFVTLSGNFSQRNISPNGINDSLNLSPSSNTTDVLNYAINPYLIHRFSSFADSRISYTYAVTDFNNKDNNDPINNDSQNRELEARLSSGTQFIRWQWNLNYEYRTEDRDNINIVSAQFQRFLFNSRIPLTQVNNTRLILNVGYEENDYDSFVTDQASGTEWGIGMSWSPSTRSTIEMIAGERYFGSTYQFLIAHQRRNMNLNVDYIEEITTTNSIRRNNPVFMNGNVANDPTSSTNFNIVLNKQLTGALEFNRRKLAANLTLSVATRKSLQNQQVEDNYRLSPALTVTLNRRSNVTMSAEWVQRKFSQRRKDERYESSLALSHRLSRKTSTTLTYSYLDQNSTIDAFAYSRNLISIALNMTF